MHTKPDKSSFYKGCKRLKGLCQQKPSISDITAISLLGFI